jgi:hypothetical protein
LVTRETIRNLYVHLSRVVATSPLIVHTGQTGIGAGLPGGQGIKLR